MRKSISFLLKLCWKADKLYVIEMFFSKIITSLLPLFIIIIPKYIIDELLGEQRIEVISFWTILLLSVFLIGTMVSSYLEYHSMYHRSKCYDSFQLELAGKMIMADYESLEDPEFMNIRQQAEKFLYGEGWGFGSVLERTFGVIGNIFTLSGIIVIIATLEPLMIILFVTLVLLSSLYESRSKKKSIEWDLERSAVERRTGYYKSVLTDYQYGKEIRNYNLGGWLGKSYEKELAEARVFYKKSGTLFTRTACFSAFMTFLQQAITYAYLIFRFIGGMISIGEFTMYISAVASFSSAMKNVMDSIVDIKRFGAYYDSVEKFLNMPCKLRDGKNLPLPESDKYTIEFKNVSYRYRATQNDALSNISFLLHTNEKIALVGENGAGKTTISKLLMRLYDPSDGEILLNGVNIKDIKYNEYVSLFSTVFQDFKLFSFSIEDNITFNRKLINSGLSEAEIIAKMGLSKLISNLPLAIKTPLHKDFDPDGVELSGGEAQKLALSRALYNSSSFLILDEPTSALDPRAESNLYNMFDEVVDKKGAVYITHRLSSTVFCDSILVLKDGRIVEKGTHKELMSQKGLYSELFTLQAKRYSNPDIPCDYIEKIDRV